MKFHQLKVMGFELVRADQISVQDLAEKKDWGISRRLKIRAKYFEGFLKQLLRSFLNSAMRIRSGSTIRRHAAVIQAATAFMDIRSLS